MKNTLKLTTLTLCAAMLLSACGTPNSPSGTEREKDVTEASETEKTSAPETSSSKASTTEATTTMTAATTTTATTAEPVKPNQPVGIRAGKHEDYRKLDTISGKIVMCSTNGWSVTVFEGEYKPPSDAEPAENIEVTIPAEKCVMSLRASSGGIALKDSDIPDRINYDLYSAPEDFVTAYTIRPKDAVAVCDINVSSVPFVDHVKDITLGYTIDEPVKVNAFLCGYGEDVKVLIDPVYMYGLPLLSYKDIDFLFNNQYNPVQADSLLFTGTLAEGLAADFDQYAYASVTLTNVDVTYSKSEGYANTCTVTDISVIDKFDNIRDYDISENDTVISEGEKDPEMQAMFDVIMSAKDEIYPENTYGIVLLDLDFDGEPELLSTTITERQTDAYPPADCETRIYRFTGNGLKYIDSLYPLETTGNSDGKYLALTKLPDGRSAWAIVKRIEPPLPDEPSGWDEYGAYQYTLDGDTLTEYPVYSAEYELIDENAEGFDDKYAVSYYYRGEKMNITHTKLEPPEDINGEYPTYEYSWNGISSGYGSEGTVVRYAMEDFFSETEKSYALMSGWLGDSRGGYVNKTYKLSPREFAYRIAYMVDEWFAKGANDAEHDFVFVGEFAKPVIYLYPEEQTDVSVRVNFPLGGEFTCTYPEYNDGWNVTAMPDGTLYDANGDEYYCLYWEGKSRDVMDDSKGFCVAGKDTVKFLREKLMYIGLTAREANEFIIYWLPKMQDDPYNIITLHTDDYARSVPLNVSPSPDTIIRVFMTYRSSDTPVDIPEQELPHYERNGFTLVEWGGSEK